MNQIEVTVKGKRSTNTAATITKYETGHERRCSVQNTTPAQQYIQRNQLL